MALDCPWGFILDLGNQLHILMKKGLESFSSFQVGALRISITFLCLLPTAIRNLHYLNRSNVLSITIIGLFGSIIPAFLFPLAETKISSSMAGMLNSLSPVFTLIFGIAIYQRKVIKAQIAGVFLGLLGATGCFITVHSHLICMDFLSSWQHYSPE